jgi:DNA-binding SARP family transcriptional activator
MMEFRILGPLEVVDNGQALEISGAKHQALLAVLLLHANEVVSTDRLVDALWEDNPPERAHKALQVYVSQLRKLLGKQRLETKAPGYLIRVSEAEVDLGRFQALVEEGRPGEALALFRGPPLAAFAYSRFAQSEIARLEELRLACLEERIEQDLDAGRQAALVGELEGLVRDHPLRERLRRQLMLALYRSGRQAEALGVYQEGRRRLGDELGLEPSEELRRLERAILQHDPAIALPVPQAVPAEAPVAERSILVAPRTLDGLQTLLVLAEPLASSQPSWELIVAHVVPAAELAGENEALGRRRDELLERGLAARTAVFSSPTPGEDLAKLALHQEVDLVIMAVGRSPLEGEAGAVIDGAPCDVGLVLEAGGERRAGPVIVPFGAAEHDWAALELAAWVARATEAPLRLIGAASDTPDEGRDASRLLADASLIVQRTAGIAAEPLLTSPGREGVMAAAAEAGLLVVGLSERWRQEGLGKVRSEIAQLPPSPTVFVRRGPRPGGLAPAESRTRFSWSMTSAAR